MQEQKTSRLVHALPSFGDVAILLPVVFLFTALKGVTSLLSDGDTGWHLRTGEWILATGQVPRQDLFSYTREGAPWFAWEWLWDVGFGWLHSQWGLAAVVLVSILLLCATSLAIYRLAWWQSGNVVIAAGITVLAVTASSIHWHARPHLVTFPLLALAYYVVEKARLGRPALLWWLVPLTLLWTNAHGSFFLVIVLLGTYAAGEVLDLAFGSGLQAWREMALRIRPYAMVAVSCLAVSLINPYFYELHVHIWKYLLDPDLTAGVGEFMAPNFQHPVAMALEAMVLLAAIASVWSLRQKRAAHFLLLLGWAHLALQMGRNAPLFAILAAAPLAQALAEMLAAARELPGRAGLRSAAEAVRGFSEEMAAVERPWRLHLVSACGLLVLAFALANPGANTALRAEFSPKFYPAEAIRCIGSAERIYADDEWGDYLIYRLFPRTKVFVDGRSDFYGKDINKEYGRVLHAEYDWETMLERHRVDVALVRAKQAISAVLKESERWRLEYDDGLALIFRRVHPGAAPVGPAELSAAACGSGRRRDRAITNSDIGGLGATESYARR